MSGRKLYALSSGAYSDYSVHAVFSSKAVAEQAVEANKADEEWADDSRVEPIYLYDEVPNKVTAYHLNADIWDDGTVEHEHFRAELQLPWNHLWGPPPERPRVRYVRAPIHKDKGGRLEVYGSDEQSVRQAFGDRKARILAERAGIA